MLIIVTGASRGIGFELVKNLARRPGIMVAAVSRNPATLTKYVKNENTHAILPVKADITTDRGRIKLCDTVKALGLKVSGVVHNAGVLVNRPFEKTGLRELTDVFGANVFAPYLLTRQLLSLMAKKSHVVNITSMGGVQGAAKFSGLSAYSASKGALNILTECLAEELKPRDVSVNALALGAVETEMLRAAFPGYKAPVSSAKMAAFIADFLITGQQYFNGKVIPVSMSTP